MIEDQPFMSLSPSSESKMLNLGFESIWAMQRNQVNNFVVKDVGLGLDLKI